MVEDILDDFRDLDKKDNLTHGERLYLEYRFTGIRGQVKDGLLFIFNDVFIEYINSELEGNDLCAYTLLRLMSIVYRHNINVLDMVQKDCKSILELEKIYKAIYKPRWKCRLISYSNIFR